MFKFSNFQIPERKQKFWVLDKPIDTINEYISSSGQIFFSENFNQPLNFLNNKVK